jgi:hypothetical protein
MPFYHLHLSNASIEATDQEGIEVNDLAEARRRAVEGIRAFLGHELMKGTLDLRGRIDIANDTGSVVATVPFADAIVIKGLQPDQ